LVKERYSKLSNDVIITNFGVLSKRVNELTYEEGQKYN
jgi:hypothetical protein